METILNYLDSMFARFPVTEATKRARKEMTSMMEDKYNELINSGISENEAVGTVISEFGNIDEVAAELGVECSENRKIREVTREEGLNYIETVETAAEKISLAVFMCICSPIFLIIMDGLSESGLLDRKIAAVVGIIVLFVMVGLAVPVFIIYGTKLSKYDYLKEEVFNMDADSELLFQKEKDENNSGFAVRIGVGVSMLILAVIPIVVTGIIFDGNENIEGISTGIFLLLVAIGVKIIINSGMTTGCYDVLLQQGDHTPEKKKNTLIGIIGSIYWPAVTVIYLLWSFITCDWHITWVIWPVAGITFGIIAVICKIIIRNKASNL